MSDVNAYKIDLKALPMGVHNFGYELDDGWFAQVDGSEIMRGSVSAEAVITVHESYCELDYRLKGTVVVACDRCLDDLPLPVEAEEHVKLKLGNEAESEDDEYVIVDERSGVLDLQWRFYESMVLALPMQRMHEEGDCNPLMVEKLRQLDNESKPAQTDPRWDGLKQMLNN